MRSPLLSVDASAAVLCQPRYPRRRSRIVTVNADDFTAFLADRLAAIPGPAAGHRGRTPRRRVRPGATRWTRGSAAL